MAGLDEIGERGSGRKSQTKGRQLDAAAPENHFKNHPSFRDGPKDQTRNLEIPGSMLRIAPE